MKKWKLVILLLIVSTIPMNAVAIETKTSSNEVNKVKETFSEAEIDNFNDLPEDSSNNSLKNDSLINKDKDMIKDNNNKTNDVTVIEELYNYGISINKINKSMYSLDAFTKNYILSLEQYDKLKIVLNMSFSEWFEQNNFGAFPDGEGHAYNEKQKELGGPQPRSGATMSAAQRRNANKFKKDLRKGDIIIVNGSPGHAAIATSNSYILEMSGGGDIFNWLVTGIKNNNHQFNSENWLSGNWEQGARTGGNNQLGYITEWIQIYRLKDQKMAQKCADYADKMFWNSTHKYKRNILIDYRINAKTLNTNPNYCSKLVFQAFYYGSGYSPVIQNGMQNLTFVAPGALINTFSGDYKPYKVGTY